MDDKLTKAQEEYIDKLNRLKLLEAGLEYVDVDTDVKCLKSDNEEEIEEEAQAIVADIKQQNTTTDVYHDKTVWKPF